MTQAMTGVPRSVGRSQAERGPAKTSRVRHRRRTRFLAQRPAVSGARRRGAWPRALCGAHALGGRRARLCRALAASPCLATATPIALLAGHPRAHADALRDLRASRTATTAAETP